MTIMLLGIGSYYLWQKGIPQDWAKGKIIKEVEKRLNGKLKIKHIYFKFPNQAILQGIEVIPDQKPKTKNQKLKSETPTPIIKIKEIVCQLTIHSQLVSKIVVIEPYVRLHRDKTGNWNIASLFKPPPEPEKKPPAMTIIIKKANLAIKDEIFGTQTTLSPIYLSYYPEGPPPYFHIRLGHNLKVNGNIHSVSPLQASFNLRLSKKDISDYAGFLKTDWANLLQGKISGNIIGSICDKNINLETGRLFMDKGVIKLSHLKQPLTDITGDFLLLDNHSLITSNLGCKFKGIDITTQKFYLKDKQAVIELVTSKFNLKELGDICPYLSKVDLNSALKFKGKLDLNSFNLLGETELFNQTPSGYKFQISSKFNYKDKAFDNISVVLDKKTQISGNLNIAQNLFNLKAKFDKSNLKPFLSLLRMKELKNGTVTGEVITKGRLTDMEYQGKLKLEIDEQEITAKLEGNKKSLAFTSEIIQPQGKINLQAKGVRENIYQPFSLSLTGNLTNSHIFDKEFSADITFDGQFSPQTKLIEDNPLTPFIKGEVRAEHIVIDGAPLVDWSGNLIYNHPILNIATSPQTNQLSISGKIIVKDPISASLQIKNKGTDMAILTKAVKGRFDGEFIIEKRSKTQTTISGKDVRVNLSDGSVLNGNFELNKMANKIYIEQLILDEPQKINMSVKGEIDLTCPQSPFMDLEANVYELKYKNLEINTLAKFKGYLSKSQLDGLVQVSGGKINNFIIKQGEANFSYADQKFTIKELNVVSELGGILTTFGTISANELSLKFSLLGINYQDMPYTYFKQFRGQFDLIGTLRGDINNPIILASLGSEQTIILQRKIGKIVGEISYSNHEFRIVNLKVNNNLLFQGTFQHENEEITGLIDLKNESLTTLASLLLLPSKNLAGMTKGQIEIKGRLNDLTLKGAIEIKDFHTPGFDASYGEIKFALEDNILIFQKFLFLQEKGGKVEFKKYQLEFKPDGKVILTAIMENFMMANITFDGKVSFCGIGTPWNKVRGILEADNLLINQSDTFKKLASEICYENGLLEFLPVSQPNSISGKIKFISNERLEMTNIKVLKDKTEKLKINGVVELLKKTCDLRFVMDNSDLGILPLWFHEVKKPKGEVNGCLQISGNFDEPQCNGSLTITNGALTTYPFAKRLTNLHGEIQIVNNWFVSNFLEAKIGDSILVMKSNGPFTLKNLNITLKNSHPVPVSIPGFLEGGVDVDIQIKGDITSPIGSGNIRIVNARFTFPPRITTTTQSRMQWANLMITTGDNVRYYNEYVDVGIKRKGSWIRISGKGDEIKAEGIVFCRQGGRVDYLGKRFTVKRASLEFRESNRMPYLSGYATAYLGERRITLMYEDYLDEGKPVLQSLGGYPPMNEEQIINALFTRQTEYIDTDTILKMGFSQIIGKEIALSLLTPLERQISSLLGMDVELKTSAMEQMVGESFKTEKEALLPSTSIFAESEFKIGKFISNDLYVSYRGILKPWEEEEFARLKLKQEFELEYYLSGNTSLKYKWTPEGVWQKGNEYEVTVEREVRF